MQNLSVGINIHPKCSLKTNYKCICSSALKLMASTPKPFNFKPKAFIFPLLLLSLALLVITLAFWPLYFLEASPQNPEWLLVASRELHGSRAKVGFVNVDGGRDFGELHGLRDRVQVPFDQVAGDVKWNDLFPEWIDEDQKWAAPVCPDVPMPSLEAFRDLDVVVARAPCGDGAAEGRKGVRDVFRLQVNLLVAKLAVKSGLMNGEIDRTVVVVFFGSCGPMVEIFRCDDLVARGEDYRVYRPDLKKLKQKLLMPVGSCQLALPYAESGEFNFP